jgi:hypothetical protein
MIFFGRLGLRIVRAMGRLLRRAVRLASFAAAGTAVLLVLDVLLLRNKRRAEPGPVTTRRK